MPMWLLNASRALRDLEHLNRPEQQRRRRHSPGNPGGGPQRAAPAVGIGRGRVDGHRGRGVDVEAAGPRKAAAPGAPGVRLASRKRPARAQRGVGGQRVARCSRFPPTMVSAVGRRQVSGGAQLHVDPSLVQAGWPRPAAACRRGLPFTQISAPAGAPATASSPMFALACASCCSSVDLFFAIHGWSGVASASVRYRSAATKARARARRARGGPRSGRFAPFDTPVRARGNARSGLFWPRSCRPWRISASASSQELAAPAGRAKAITSAAANSLPTLPAYLRFTSSPVNRAAAPAVLVPPRNLAGRDARPWMAFRSASSSVSVAARLLRRGRLRPRARRRVGARRQNARLRRALGRVLLRHGLGCRPPDTVARPRAPRRLGGCGRRRGWPRRAGDGLLRRDRPTPPSGPPRRGGTSPPSPSVLEVVLRRGHRRGYARSRASARAPPRVASSPRRPRAIATPPTPAGPLAGQRPGDAIGEARRLSGTARRHRRPSASGGPITTGGV